MFKQISEKKKTGKLKPSLLEEHLTRDTSVQREDLRR